MDSLKTTVNGFVRGLSDSIKGFVLIFHYDAEVPEKPRSSPTQETNLAKRRAAQQAEKKQRQASQKDETKVTHRIVQCCVLNGVVFGLSLVIFNYLLLPMLKQVLSLFLAEGAGAVWHYARPTLTAVFDMLWVLPLFVLSRIINTIWFQDIADSAYRQRQGRPQLISSLSKLVADVLISIFIQLLFLVQANLLMLLPIMGINVVVGGVHMCLLNALYAFEYRWFNMGWELYKRLSFVEENWPYFMGFGLPLAFITMYPSSVYVSGCLFALLFPVFIISANEADPVLYPKGYPLQLFSGVVGLSNRIIQSLVTKRQALPNPPAPSRR
ncbi:etoposide-induced protein 2.4 homolog isoform X1 [Penaeus vannamei]|uniref:Putative etoposide-induced protein 2.4-like n=1 Tax=Penaeus vannamei TaxID=6689 RepID=A0A423TP85_PENVA|nr:etoposide-induced protein 2.4 homolog isoform X1 [Penaeus vannamei]ROT78274.1 putative etoposide-induced protein 2.4-like [Penaeus vannamei]